MAAFDMGFAAKTKKRFWDGFLEVGQYRDVYTVASKKSRF
jgi:hypothetical protein